MSQMNALIWGITFFCLLVFFVFLFRSFYFFDKLIKLQYANQKAEWERDGKAGGFIWLPDDSTWSQEWLARGRVYESWCRQAPLWAEQEGVKKDFRKLKMAKIVASFSIIAFLLAFGFGVWVK